MGPSIKAENESQVLKLQEEVEHPDESVRSRRRDFLSPKLNFGPARVSQGLVFFSQPDFRHVLIVYPGQGVKSKPIP